LSRSGRKAKSNKYAQQTAKSVVEKRNKRISQPDCTFCFVSFCKQKAFRPTTETKSIVAKSRK